MARNLMSKLNLSNGLATEHYNINVKVDTTISLEDLLNLEHLGTLCQESANEIDRALLTLEEADEVLNDIQEVENNVADTLGTEPIDVVTGEPLNGNGNDGASTENEGNVENDTTSNNDESLPDNNNKEIAAAVAQESLRYVYKRLQLDFNKIKISQEALIAQPITALHLAREEAQEAGKSLWERIKAFFVKLWNSIKAFFGNVKAGIDAHVEILEKLKAKVSDLKFGGGEELDLSIAAKILNNGIPLRNGKPGTNTTQHFLYYTRYLKQCTDIAQSLLKYANDITNGNGITNNEELDTLITHATVDGPEDENTPEYTIGYASTEDEANKYAKTLIAMNNAECEKSLENILTYAKTATQEITKIENRLKELEKVLNKEPEGDIAKLKKIIPALAAVSKSFGKHTLGYSKTVLQVVNASMKKAGVSSSGKETKKNSNNDSLITANIKRAVAEKDIFKLQAYLIASIVVDETLKRLDAGLQYCVKNGIPESEIYEPHDGREISDDITEENYKKLWAGLNSNFSRERVEALRKVAKQLYPQKD